MTKNEERRTKDEGRSDYDYDDDVLSPLIRGGSKAGFYLMVHRDTETQSYFLTLTMTMTMT